jgi:hypothetical protein
MPLSDNDLATIGMKPMHTGVERAAGCVRSSRTLPLSCTSHARLMHVSCTFHARVPNGTKPAQTHADSRLLVENWGSLAETWEDSRKQCGVGCLALAIRVADDVLITCTRVLPGCARVPYRVNWA